MKTPMERSAEAFAELATVVTFNGRRLLRAELEAHYRLHVPDPNNLARRAPMEPRRKRRQIIRDLRAKARSEGLSKREAAEKYFFRPVIGYLGPS